MRGPSMRSAIAILLFCGATEAALAGSGNCRYRTYDFGSYENTTVDVPVTVGAGVICGTVLGETGGHYVEQTSIVVAPKHGAAVTRGLYVAYRSQPKYRGPDTFTYERTVKDRTGRRYKSRVRLQITVEP